MDGHAAVLQISTRSRPDPLSKRWFGLDWREHLPWQLCGVSVEVGEMDDVLPFIERLYPQLFWREGDDGWLDDGMSAAKLRFFEDADVFLIKDDGELVGLEIAHPTDWSTYYLRTHALLPAYRGRGIMAEMMKRRSEVLATVGVQRIEGDVVPANVAQMIAHTKIGCVVTGTLNTDRWGALVRITKYIESNSDDVFRKQFCCGTWPRCHE
jgi:RimJ/RimL family protein N-acetyltransferase